MSLYRNKIEVSVTVVGKIVMIELQGSGELVELAYNDLAARFEMLIEAEVVKWYKARADHFVLMPQQGWEPAELLTEIKRQLRL